MPRRAVQLPDHPDCLNCGTPLNGQYCGQCGQRASSRLISLWELLSDAFGDLLELDSRLWRTVIPLLARPGKLTRDYLEGRRARYMPPFRMYLVLSVVFFVVAFFDPRDDLSLLFEPEPENVPEQAIETPEAADEAPAAIEDRDEGGNMFTVTGTSNGLNLDYDPKTDTCTASGVDELPAWLQRRLTQDRLEEICERIAADQGKTFFSLMLDNIPIALIVLLPFMALVLKGLYPLSRRYFVEHLLFVVHYHAFFFLILTLQILFSRLADLVFIPEPISVLVVVAAGFYVPVYLYKAMRRVYDQGHLLTMTKYVALSVAYLAGVSVTIMGALVVALFSV